MGNIAKRGRGIKSFSKLKRKQKAASFYAIYERINI
jgi:hypothetical protein